MKRIVSGPRAIQEALAADPRNVHAIYVLGGKRKGLADLLKNAKRAGVPVEERAPRELNALAGEARHQGAVAISALNGSGIEGLLHCIDDALPPRDPWWTEASGLIGMPHGAGARGERAGWSGDAAAASESECFDFDTAAFFSQFLSQIQMTSCKSDATIPDCVPNTDPRRDSLSGQPDPDTCSGLTSDPTWSPLCTPSLFFHIDALHSWPVGLHCAILFLPTTQVYILCDHCP